MREQRERALAVLADMGAPYEIEEHPAVYTIEEMEALGICERGKVAKNLFLRNASGKVHYLVTLVKEKHADLAAIREKLGCSRLSFASEERLKKHLDLVPGEVGPLGVLNDQSAQVIFVLDRELLHEKRVGMHPNDNTATIWIAMDEVERIVRAHGNPVIHLEI